MEAANRNAIAASSPAPALRAIVAKIAIMKVNPRIDRIDSCGSNRLRRTGSSMEDFVFEVNQIPRLWLNCVLLNGESELFRSPEFSESYSGCNQDLQALFQTKETSYLFHAGSFPDRLSSTPTPRDKSCETPKEMG